MYAHFLIHFHNLKNADCAVIFVMQLYPCSHFYYEQTISFSEERKLNVAWQPQRALSLKSRCWCNQQKPKALILKCCALNSGLASQCYCYFLTWQTLLMNIHSQRTVNCSLARSSTSSTRHPVYPGVFFCQTDKQQTGWIKVIISNVIFLYMLNTSCLVPQRHRGNILFKCVFKAFYTTKCL